MKLHSPLVAVQNLLFGVPFRKFREGKQFLHCVFAGRMKGSEVSGVLCQQRLNRNYHQIGRQRAINQKLEFQPQTVILSPDLYYQLSLFDYFSLKQFIIDLHYSMNLYLLIALNLSLISLVAYFIVDPSSEFKPVTTQSLCLQGSDPLCVECYRRDPAALQDRAFKIQSNEDITVLKVTENVVDLTCNEYLQFIDVQKGSKDKKEIALQKMAPLQQIMAEIKGVLERITESGIVVPSYQQFVIYKWGDFKSGRTKVYAPNTENYKNISSYFTYGFNFILLLILVAYIADNSFLAEQSTPTKLCLGFIVALMELWLLDVYSPICLYLCRLFVLSIGLVRLRVNNFKVMAFFGLGLFLTYFQATVPLFIAVVLVLLLYYGKGQSESAEVQRYLVLFYTILLLNHLYVYNYVYLLNDFRNLAIELCVIITVPLGLFLLPNDKSYKPYRPVDPEIRSISLSGYDEEESTNI